MCTHWGSKRLLPKPFLKDPPSCRTAVWRMQTRGGSKLRSRESFQPNFLISIPHSMEHLLHELGITLAANKNTSHCSGLSYLYQLLSDPTLTG